MASSARVSRLSAFYDCYDIQDESDFRSAKYAGRNGPSWSITATWFYVSVFDLRMEIHVVLILSL